MWRNFRCLHMTDVEKYEIFHIWHVCHVENVTKYAKFIAIYVVAKSVIHAVLSRNFMWRKIEPKSTFVEKNDKYQVCLWHHSSLCSTSVVIVSLNIGPKRALKKDKTLPKAQRTEKLSAQIRLTKEETFVKHGLGLVWQSANNTRNNHSSSSLSINNPKFQIIASVLFLHVGFLCVLFFTLFPTMGTT